MRGGHHFFSVEYFLPFLMLSIITKILYVGSFNYFVFTIHMRSNSYILNTGVRDLAGSFL